MFDHAVVELEKFNIRLFRNFIFVFFLLLFFLRLIMESRELEDKIKLAETQVNSLKQI